MFAFCEIKVLLHHVQREARQVICSREDVFAFTPQAISRVVARV